MRSGGGCASHDLGLPVRMLRTHCAKRQGFRLGDTLSLERWARSPNCLGEKQNARRQPNTFARSFALPLCR